MSTIIRTGPRLSGLLERLFEKGTRRGNESYGIEGEEIGSSEVLSICDGLQCGPVVVTLAVLCSCCASPAQHLSRPLVNICKSV